MIQERVKEFSELSTENQKQKLIAMLSQIQDPEWFFDKVLETIKTNQQLTSENYIWVYQDIIKFWEEIENISKEEKQDLMSKLHQKILDIHAEEEREMAEENPDDILNNI